MKKILAFSSMMLIISGCAKYPTMLSFTPASVMINYTGSDLHQATAMAQQYCASMGKDAQYVRTEEGGMLSSKRHGFFNCIESSKNSNSQSNGSSSQTPVINNFR
jgi:hypothetical protein